MRIIIFFTAILLAQFSFAQSLNDYKYVIVDNQYEFQDEANEYRLNEMMVFELKKRGFEAFRNLEILPADLNKGVCNSLQLKVTSSKGLRIKMVFDFVNCDGTIIYTTQEGIGRTKDNKKAYREALRDAMSSLDEVEYDYEPANHDTNTGSDFKINNNSAKEKSELKVSDSRFSPEALRIQESLKNIPSSYLSTDSQFALIVDGKNYHILKNNDIIGQLKKSQSGCYLAISTEFIGIGYEKDNSFIIEYNKNGIQFLTFTKQ